MSGALVLTTAAVLVLGIFAGVDLLIDPASAGPPEVLSAEVTDADPGTTTVTNTVALEDFIGIFETAEVTGHSLVSTTARKVGGIGVAMPPASTTSTSVPVAHSSTSTTKPSRVTTTQLSPSSTSGGSSPTTVPGPSIPTTTVANPPSTTARTPVTTPTTTASSTTTILSTTTTIATSTTTLIDATTTSCGNNGGGKGNC